MSICKKSNLNSLLLVLRRNILEAIKKENLKHDLTFSQVEVLHFIGPSGKATMKSVAEYLKISPPSATEMIYQMEQKGLIKRGNNKKDKRVVYVTFTPEAKKIFKSIHKRKELVLQKMITKLNIEDKTNLERIIKILITN
jgi:DNA-binding MarR family transcriptional regulator